MSYCLKKRNSKTSSLRYHVTQGTWVRLCHGAARGLVAGSPESDEGAPGAAGAHAGRPPAWSHTRATQGAAQS